MFNQLNALADLSETRNQQRQSASEKQLAKALGLLQQAHDEGFRQPLRLQEAAGQLVEAIKLRRTDVRPYLGLAYVFMLLEDHAMAQKYVHQALQLEADNPLAKKFQERIAVDYQRVAQRRQQQRSQPHKQMPAPDVTGSKPVPASTSPIESFDFDALFEVTESRIRQLVRELMLAGMPGPADEAKGMSVLQQRLEKHRQAHTTILSELKVIDAEIDCSDLERLLKPVEAHLKRLEQVITVSQQLIALRSRIKDEVEVVEQICEETRNCQDKADLEILEENLEALLDNADGYANEIEALQAKLYPLEGIEGLYGKLQEKIESYQDLLEEAHARLDT
ncbi:MAG: hypothetical protein ACAI44_23855 [Candidatus Sericytochromatia bacterium]